MIKLLRLLFKQLRSEQQGVQNTIICQQKVFEETILEFQSYWSSKMAGHRALLAEKDSKITELTEELELVIRDNERLDRKLDEVVEERHRRGRLIEEDNWNSIHEIMDQVSVSKAKIEDLS